MCVVCNGAYRIDRNVLRQQTIQLEAEPLAVYLRLTIKMSCHEAGMDTCVSAAGTCYGNLMPQWHLQGIFNLLLYADGIGLSLPAVVECAIVREQYEIAIHENCCIYLTVMW